MEKNSLNTFDCIVVGAGHAGIEASIACSRLGLKTLLTTLNIDNIGLMPCNPAVGGPAKSNLVREIDALGGVMAELADSTYMQLKTLNSSKGPAVHALRAQSDKKEYKALARHFVEKEENLTLKQTHIVDLIVENQEIKGAVDELGIEYFAPTVVLTTGTSLEGRIFIGLKSFSQGRLGERSAQGLGVKLRELGFNVRKLKTGTPARIDGRTLDYSKLELHPGDEVINNMPRFFSFKDNRPIREQYPCYLTKTNEKTHEIIRANLQYSPLYRGLITGRGPRYCPSIEDKVVRFSHNPSHHIFIEPEGRDTYEMYIQGFSTSLPIEAQFEMIHSLPGLEHVSVIKPAYAVEYDSVCALELDEGLMTKKIKGLFMAGQINGTSGYEEAAAQGLVAGINVKNYLDKKDYIEITRSNSYIGTLIDDLITKDIDEPYRMMTSRSEYRLILRQDNADLRLMELGYKAGLVSEKEIQKKRFKASEIDAQFEKLKNFKIPANETNKKILSKYQEPLETGTNGLLILKRPNVDYKVLKELGYNSNIDSINNYLIRDIEEQTEVLIKYEGYIKRQKEQIENQSKTDNIKIPDDINYEEIKQISTESKEKLIKIKPKTIGQALRIGGVKPADVSVLMVLIEQHRIKQIK
ncbi:MAG: tRNA uridine-5-carboxymethylaminomethyl(34) synthesis enzyme MnmG [Candidatus Gastranaerophilales bacterium]|nr:tRNA uridine-5-carboxymethylaminomethyl(34) synthesis enzyme MnmG [Candidatus Gastranaerophilales bacterium]